MKRVGVRRSREESGGASEEPGGTRSQDGGTRRSPEEPRGARRSTRGESWRTQPHLPLKTPPRNRKKKKGNKLEEEEGEVGRQTAQESHRRAQDSPGQDSPGELHESLPGIPPRAARKGFRKHVFCVEIMLFGRPAKTEPRRAPGEPRKVPVEPQGAQESPRQVFEDKILPSSEDPTP